MHFRAVDEKDWLEIDRIQKDAYDASLLEDLSILKQKVTASPECCSVAEVTHGQLVGYCLMHPYQIGLVPSLNQDFENIDFDEESNLFIHDLAIESASQGKGLAQQLFLSQKKKALDLGYKSLSLVAVRNSYKFWQKMGFKTQFQDTLHSYGDDVFYMIQHL